MDHVQVGPWALPGLSFKKTPLPVELLNEMKEWAEQNRCGKCMNDTLWRFKNAAQRDWFIMRWLDSIPKEDSRT